MSRTVHLSISDFVTDFKNAEHKDEQALVISKAFEKVIAEQEVVKREIKQQLKEEINFQDLVTQRYLSDQDLVTKDYLEKELYKNKLELIEYISQQKWQLASLIIGVAILFPVIQLIYKHFFGF